MAADMPAPQVVDIVQTGRSHKIISKTEPKRFNRRLF